jgi:glycosyltransferase involved in cell wall biosynthesis
MRIGVNTRFLLNNKLEGMGLFTHEVVRRLVQQNPQHEFIFFFDRKFSPDFIYGPNVKPVVLFPPARHPFLFIWWFEWSVAQALKKYRADVFLSPDNFLSLRTATPTVLVTHDLAHAHYPHWNTFFQRKYYQFFTSKFNRKAKRIVAVSEFTKRDIMNRYGVVGNKIDAACNGCRSIFKPLGEAEKQKVRENFSGGQPYFFYVGAVHPRKNVHRLIRAFDHFKSLTKSSVKLLIAGRFAWSSGEVKAAFDNSTSQPDIKFLGFVKDEDLARLMGGALACTYVSLF